MNKKKKSTNYFFSDTIKDMDFEADWVEVMDVVNNKQRYEQEIFEELYKEALKIKSGLRSTPHKLKAYFGPQLVVGDPGYEVDRMIYEIKVLTLKELERNKIVRGFEIKVEHDAENNAFVYALTRCYPQKVIDMHDKGGVQLLQISPPELAQQDSIKQSMQDVIKAKPIRSIYLDENRKVLTINDGEREIDFRHRQKEELGETKAFKILVALWDCRKELKNGKIRAGKKGDIVPLHILKQMSKSLGEQAVIQSIKRLNGRFRKEEVPIKIISSPKRKEAMLTVDFSA